jgi:hypothetical protein
MGKNSTPCDGVDNLLLENVEKTDCENCWDKTASAVGVGTAATNK